MVNSTVHYLSIDFFGRLSMGNREPHKLAICAAGTLPQRVPQGGRVAAATQLEPLDACGNPEQCELHHEICLYKMG